MSYLPLTTNTSQLILRIGRVKLADMTSGSASVSAPGMGMTSADNGIPAVVFGAGPAGAPLITTILSVSDGNTATLAASASTTVTDVSLIIFRAYSTLKGSIYWNGSLTVRGTARFSIATASFVPLVGMPVLLHDTVDGDLFGGSIASVKASNTYYSQSFTKYDCDCEGYEKLLAKRTTGDLTDTPMTPATSNPLNGTFRQMSMGDIGAYIVKHAFSGDGMGSTVIAGPTLDFGTRLEYGDAALDRLVALASNDVDKYFWYVDPWRVAVLAKQSTYVAPFSILDFDGSDSNVRLAVSVTRDRQKYVNRGIADLGAYIGDATTETYPGDGSSQQFGLLNAVAAAPTVSVDLGAGPVDQTVGVLNVDTGKDWYYTLQSNIITQDTGGTPLGLTDTISITYSPVTTNEVEYQNDTAVDERSGVEGGTGYYERVQQSGSLSTYSDGLALATAIATNYSTIPERVELQTYRGGLRPGMYIDIKLTDIGVDSRFLIDSVTLTTDNNVKLYAFTAIDGALIGDWRATLANAFGSGGSGTAAGSGGGGGTAFAGSINLSVNGPLAIGADQCPIIAPLASTPASAVVATVKQAPTGHDLVIPILSNGVAWMTLTIAATTTTISATGTQISTAGPLTALGAVRLDLSAVGTTIPGEDLAVQIYY